MTTSRKSSSRKPATQIESQKVTIPRKLVRASFFCAIAIAFSILPFRNAVGQLSKGSAVIGPSTTSTPYACTSAGIQQAISDAVNLTHGITQKVVDATNCISMTGSAFNSEIYVGAVPNPLKPEIERIKFFLPANGTWTANFSDTSKYALQWGNGVMIYGGTGSGEGQPFSITTASGTTLKAVCGNDPANGNAGYFHAEGFSCSVGNGSAVTDAVIAIGNTLDESYVGHMTGAVAGSATVPRVLWVYNACCSATFEDINAEAFNNANTVPCYFGFPPGLGTNLSNYGIHVSKLSCIHPGNGANAMLIFQTGFSSLNQGIGNSFRDIYMEQLPTGQSGGQDSSTPWVAVRQYGGTYSAADFLEGFRASVDTSNSVRCVIDLGSGSRVNVSNLSLSNTSICGIHDGTLANPVWIEGVANSVVASYNMTPLVLGGSTVASLPPANQSIGAMLRVADSTAITIEGQACVGGGTNTALAFSNGSAWKCF
jgi:hypothetical protein